VAEAALQRALDELGGRAAEADERPAPPATAAPAPAPAPPTAPALPEPAPAAAADAQPARPAAGAWNLNDLRRLVAQHSPDYPDRVDEWQSYLFLLRDYADAHGRVPSQFDALIEDTFGELVGAG